MSMKKVLIFTLFLLVGTSSALWAQEDPAASQTGRITGVATLQGDNSPIAFAQVGIRDTSMITLTEEDGTFAFENVAPGTYTLVIVEETIKSFETVITVETGKTTSIECQLLTAGMTGAETKGAQVVGAEVVVEGKRERTAVSKQTISREELMAVPGANNDAIRVVGNLPGVAQAPLGGGFSQGLVIRGTSPEDSKYYFNGFEIPQLFHFGFLISVINAELLEDIAYSPGGYGAKYGDALGGIVEVSARKPDADRFGGVVDLATYSSFVLFEGPAGDKASYAGAVRRSFIDFILPEVLPDDQEGFTVVPRFYDYTGIFQLDLNESNEMQFVVFGSDDQLGLVSDEVDDEEPLEGTGFDMRSSWHRGDAKWTWFGNSKLFNELALSFLYVEFEAGGGDFLTFRSKNLNPSLRDDMSIAIGNWNELRFGVQGEMAFVTLTADLPRFPKEGEAFIGIGNSDVITSEIEDEFIRGAAYVDDVMEPADWVQLVPGVRVNYEGTLGLATIDPRLTMKFFPTEKSTIKAATGMYHQWPQYDESIEDYGAEGLEAEVAYLGNLGFEYDFGEQYSIDVQGFYKDMQNLVSSTDSDSEEPYDNAGKGFVYGAELLARKKLTDRFFGWISYTYSVSRRKDRPDSDWRYFDEDQRHNFIILGSYELGKKRLWRLGAKWQFSTGLPYTELTGSIYNVDSDSYIPLYSDEVNGERRGPYHQLDLRLDKLWEFTNWSLNTYLDLQNVYFMEYPFGYEYNFDYTEERVVTFPLFFPNIGVQARF
jgi:TonB-dependent Receptor Plug Domain/Carboxypeptidase regulatory-like domain